MRSRWNNVNSMGREACTVRVVVSKGQAVLFSLLLGCVVSVSNSMAATPSITSSHSKGAKGDIPPNRSPNGPRSDGSSDNAPGNPAEDLSDPETSRKIEALLNLQSARIPAPEITGTNYTLEGEKVGSMPRTDIELDQDVAHTSLSPADKDQYVSSGALGPCVGIFVVFTDGSMIAGHYALESSAEGINDGSGNYAAMMQEIRERTERGDQVARVFVGGAQSTTIDENTGEQSFPSRDKVRAGVIQELLSTARIGRSLLTTAWNDGEGHVELIVSPSERYLLVYGKIPGTTSYREHIVQPPRRQPR